MCPDCTTGYKKDKSPCDACYTLGINGSLYTKRALLMLVTSGFTDLECEPLLRMAARIAMGNKKYGHLTDLNSCDWFKEEGYEQGDAFVYHVWEDMKREAAIAREALVWRHPCGNMIEYSTRPEGCVGYSGCLNPDQPWVYYGGT